MPYKIDLDNHLRKCITIITTCIVLVAGAFATVLAFVTFSGEEAPSVRDLHMKQHQEEGARLDSMISVLESINSNLENDAE